MNRIKVTCAALLLAATTVMATEKITIKDVTGGTFMAQTISGMKVINGTDTYARISTDGTKIESYSFKTGKLVKTLFDLNTASGEKIDAIDGYILSPDDTKMLIQTKTEPVYRRSFKADYYIYNIQRNKLEKLSKNGREQEPVWSNDGNQVAFVHDNNIYLVKLLYDNALSQVTKDGKFNEVINGLPDWVNEEEFSFNSALCFNADGTKLCWLRYDESMVKTYDLQMYKGLKPERTANEIYPTAYSYKYPKAGEDNSKTTAWSYDIKSHRTRQLEVPVDADGYMPRIIPTNNANSVIIYTMNRHQDELNIFTVNPSSTIAQLLIKEKVDKYVKEEAMSGVRVYGNHILLPSDRSGHMGLYLYSLTGQLKQKVCFDYDITAVYGFDEAKGDIYYQAAALNPHDRQIFVTHRNGKTERLTNQEGNNGALFSGDFQYFINSWSDYNTPNVFTVRSGNGKVLSTPVDNAKLKNKLKNYEWTQKETFSFTTSEGVKLDGWMVRPKNFDPQKKYPVIMFQYSGPGNQQVMNSWSAGSMGQGGAFEEYLASEGFIVVCVDGRGTGGRGAEFEKCTYLHLGQLEARDQVETALWLGKQSYVDANRIGIWGWSYGGFCTLMSMSEGRGVFNSGVAVAPPTSYRFYDTIYTERYMRTPKENPDGYADNAISRAEALHGRLLLCHGLADDNVHPQNSIEYSEALVQADKDFKENFYTNRNHGISGGNTRTHLLRQIVQWFKAM